LSLGVIAKGITVKPRYVDLSLAEDAKRRIDGK